jgi:hypothetical protein
MTKPDNLKKEQKSSLAIFSVKKLKMVDSVNLK